jgi:hypothetical protein
VQVPTGAVAIQIPSGQIQMPGINPVQVGQQVIPGLFPPAVSAAVVNPTQQQVVNPVPPTPTAPTDKPNCYAGGKAHEDGSVRYNENLEGCLVCKLAVSCMNACMQKK